jgi:hypothetical protein
VSPAGCRVSPAGRQVLPAGHQVSPAGRQVSPAGCRVLPAGEGASPAGPRWQKDTSTRFSRGKLVEFPQSLRPTQTMQDAIVVIVRLCDQGNSTFLADNT